MNVILIISDTFRYDNLFDRAAMPVRTPCLDAFSKRAVSCRRFFTSSFPTIPQRPDIPRGRHGWPWYPWQELKASTRNHLPVLLGKAGYVSQLLCDCPHLFRAGFQNTSARRSTFRRTSTVRTLTAGSTTLATHTGASVTRTAYRSSSSASLRSSSAATARFFSAAELADLPRRRSSCEESAP